MKGPDWGTAFKLKSYDGSLVWGVNLSTCPLHCAALSNVFCYAPTWVVFTLALLNAIHPCTFPFLQPAGKEIATCRLCVNAWQFVSLRKLLVGWKPMIPAVMQSLHSLGSWEMPSYNGDTEKQERIFFSPVPDPLAKDLWPLPCIPVKFP